MPRVDILDMLQTVMVYWAIGLLQLNQCNCQCINSFSDAKAAEAAASAANAAAYYDPNKPQYAYVPPPYVRSVNFSKSGDQF